MRKAIRRFWRRVRLYAVFGSLLWPACAGWQKNLVLDTTPVCNPMGTLPTTEDVCGGKTFNGRSCVRCPSNNECVDPVDFVYCVATCDDPDCH